MTHGLVMKVPEPTEFYDASHTEVGRRSTGRAAGLLLHLGRGTDDGREVLEIWESKDKSTASSPRSSGRRWTPCRPPMRGGVNR